MKLKDPEGWAAAQAANPVPDGLDPEPDGWPEDLTHDQLGDCYGAIVIIAAERWADAMEETLAANADLDFPSVATVGDIADLLFHSVNRDLGNWGLTGFQYGAAVSILAQVWEHGEELRVWHNLATQLRDEGERANADGGVLNPALLLSVEEQA